MNELAPSNAWSRFWAKGGWWRSIILVAGYYALYQAASLPLLPFSGLLGDPGSAKNTLLAVALPIAIGCLILIVFGLTTGQFRRVFTRHERRGSWWMWIAVGVVLLFNVLRFATVDYSTAGLAVVLAWLVAGLFIGFAEELVTRGYVVDLMRRAGNREIVVAVVSAALFAAMHAGNLLAGQALIPTLLQLLYTFAFGICMYLALRVTGSLIVPILLHATTDPSIFLQTGYPVEGALTSIAGLGNIAVIAAGLISLIFIRGRVGESSRPLVPRRE